VFHKALAVLGPLLVIIYTTPLSSLISDSSVKHHLYADDTYQLFISFSALDFTLNIAHLKTTIDNVSTWMSADLLSVNKSEFFLIGLLQQLIKVTDPTLFMPSHVIITPTNSTRNLGVIFDSSLSLSQNIYHSCLSCFLSIRDLRLKRPLAKKSRLRHIRLAIKSGYLRNHASQSPR